MEEIKQHINGDKEIVIVTGLSGAGKSSAINILEDLGYYAVDNLPCDIIPFFLKTSREKIALGLDIRTFNKIDEVFDILKQLKKEKIKYSIIFMEASEETILNRYNLTRRKHPLLSPTLSESIKKESEIMYILKDIASGIIDTTYLNIKNLPEQLITLLNIDRTHKDMNIHIISFGFKYGVPIDVDLVFDVRFLPNPYYYEELKDKNGENAEILDFLLGFPITKNFYLKLIDMLSFLIPNYIKEGKKHLTIGIGCSGGKHRSVALSSILSKELKKMKNLNIYLTHRENERGNW
ncbi:RNase adapter RapZ [Fusobacterium sp. PH5-44]|uniref:RNase adapter RapZ n=1 Tax=unclassified Fusobacterium TaxID=2648384 RepID=UPI003D1A9FA9